MRVCAHCERLFLRGYDCPKCGFASYRAIHVYDRWWKVLWYYVTQLPWRRKR
jgi:hypothetical protein